MAINVKIEVRNLEKVNADISRIDSSFFTMNIMDFAERIADQAKLQLRTHYVTNRQQTGRLLESIHAVSLEGGKSALIVADAQREGFSYGVPVELGRKGFSARDKKIRFMGREGFPVYTFHVRPAAGKHFMKAAAEWGARNIENYMQRRIRRIIASKGRIKK